MKIALTGTEYFWGNKMLMALIQDQSIETILCLDIKEPKLLSQTQQNETISQKVSFAPMTYKRPFHYLWANALEKIKPDVLLLCPFSVEYCYQDNYQAHLTGAENSLRVLRKALEIKIPRIIVLSSCLAYGAHWSNPVYIKEDQLLLGDRKYQHIRGIIEIENACHSAIATNPQFSSIAILRHALTLGPTIDNTLTRFLRKPVLPVYLGFDPVIQLIHENDVVKAMMHAIHTHEATGAFNIGTETYLSLREMYDMLGKIKIPILHPLVNLSADILWRLQLTQFSPAFMEMLKYRVVMDTNRSKTILGFHPTYSIIDTLLDFKSKIKEK